MIIILAVFVLPARARTEAMLKPLTKDGKIVASLPKPSEIREYVLEQISKITVE